MELFCAVAAVVCVLSSGRAASDVVPRAIPRAGDARDAVAAAANAFGYDLYRVAGRDSANLVISPLSAAAVLALAWHGAGGATAKQLGDALHLPPDSRRVADGYRALHNFLQGASSPDSGMVLRVANKLYAQRGFRVKDSFRQAAVGNFAADAEEVDFATEPENARRAINAWVEDYTRGNIRNLFGQGSPSADTLLVLVNAVYFKAGWDKPFHETESHMASFHLSNTAQVNVLTMHKYAEFMYGYLPHLHSKVMVLNYLPNEEDNIRTKMVIVLPDSANGLRALEDGLFNLDLNRLPLERRNVNVSLPKFRIEAKHELKDMLIQLGVTDLFTRNADLRGVTDSPIYVSKAVQKTFIEVNEKGTEASAATGLEYVFFSGPPPKADFIANRPFLFFVMRGDLILFMGRVTDPRVAVPL